MLSLEVSVAQPQELYSLTQNQGSFNLHETLKDCMKLPQENKNGRHSF